MKKMLTSAIVALALTFSVSACGEPVDDSTGESKYSQDDGEYGLIPESENYLKKVVVDGTTCIIFSDNAISCDWEAPSQEPAPEFDGLG